MIKMMTQQDDLFASNADALVNPVNCHGRSGKGLAKEFVRRFPWYQGLYKQLCTQGKMEVGITVLHQYNWDDPLIIDFPTKDWHYNPSKLQWVRDGLHHLVNVLLPRHPKVMTVALPALGCGCGELEWSKVQNLISEACQESPVTFYVYPPK